MKNLSLSLVAFVVTLCQTFTTYGQFGGDIKLKITYEGKPLVGYTITGSINGHDIGGKGVTDSNGDVTLRTDPLPIPNIDVKGVKQCGSATYEWEASGFVYVSPTSNNNSYHLQLDRVAKQMSEMSGLPMATIMESYGINCTGSQSSTATTSSPSLSNSTSSDSQESKLGSNDTESNAATTTTTTVEVDPRQAMENKRTMLINQIARCDEKIQKFSEKSEEEGTSTSDQNDYLYQVAELEIEKKRKLLELDETDKKLSRPDLNLTSEERLYYKSEDSKLKDEEQKLKEDKKQGISLVEEVETEDLMEFSEQEVQNMSTLELKKRKLDFNTKIKQIEIKLKTRSSVMKQDKITQLENEITVLKNTVTLIEAELEARGK